MYGLKRPPYSDISACNSRNYYHQVIIKDPNYQPLIGKTQQKQIPQFNQEDMNGDCSIPENNFRTGELHPELVPQTNQTTFKQLGAGTSQVPQFVNYGSPYIETKGTIQQMGNIYNPYAFNDGKNMVKHPTGYLYPAGLGKDTKPAFPLRPVEKLGPIYSLSEKDGRSTAISSEEYDEIKKRQQMERPNRINYQPQSELDTKLNVQYNQPEHTSTGNPLVNQYCYNKHYRIDAQPNSQMNCQTNPQINCRANPQLDFTYDNHMGTNSANSTNNQYVYPEGGDRYQMDNTQIPNHINTVYNPPECAEGSGFPEMNQLFHTQAFKPNIDYHYLQDQNQDDKLYSQTKFEYQYEK